MNSIVVLPLPGIPEVPVKVQISCNLEPCRLNKLIIITAQPASMRKPFPGRETGSLFGVALATWFSEGVSWWEMEIVI